MARHDSTASNSNTRHSNTHHSSTTDFSALSPAEIDRLVERGRRLRARQAGVLYDALRRRLTALRRSSKAEVMASPAVGPGRAAT